MMTPRARIGTLRTMRVVLKPLDMHPRTQARRMLVARHGHRAKFVRMVRTREMVYGMPVYEVKYRVESPLIAAPKRV